MVATLEFQGRKANPRRSAHAATPLGEGDDQPALMRFRPLAQTDGRTGVYFADRGCSAVYPENVLSQPEKALRRLLRSSRGSRRVFCFGTFRSHRSTVESDTIRESASLRANRWFRALKPSLFFSSSTFGLIDLFDSGDIQLMTNLVKNGTLIDPHLALSGAQRRSSRNPPKKAESSSCASSGSTFATCWSGRTTTTAPFSRSMPRRSKMSRLFLRSGV
jgi:hypothetical protein